MARTLRETTISTRNARRSLAPGLHWRGLDADIHLGYRKGKRGGRWLVRWYLGDERYQQDTLAAADDAAEADGEQRLSFEQAKARAIRHVTEARARLKAEREGPAPTVRSAVEAYIEMRDAREIAQKGQGGRKRDAHGRLTRHVLSSPVADKHLHALSEKDLVDWRAGLPASLATSTKRRAANDFKAALNAAASKHRANLPAELPLVIKNGLASGEAEPPTARDKAALPDIEVRRLVDAAAEVDARDSWEGDLARMVLVLAATGARFSQAAEIRVGDVQIDQSRIMVPKSRKGRGRKKTSHIAVKVGADILDGLRPVLIGRRPNDPLLERWRHVQTPRTATEPPKWVRDRRGPWRHAAELTRPWSQVVEQARLPADVVPYSLRHSSIVRQLRARLPVRLVAALHDTSTHMIEAHYAAAIVDALDDLSAAAVIPLVSSANSANVVPIGKKTANP